MKRMITLGLVGVAFVAFSAFYSPAQVFQTSLRLTVLNSLGNPVSNAKVSIFANDEDYANDENAVAGPALTDEKGRVTFKNLDEKAYYVKAVKGDMSNYNEGEQMGKLEKNKLNKVNVIISE
jgi:uncharacterized GH25 family protein